MKELARDPICIPHGNRQWCGDHQRVGRGRGLGRSGQGGGEGSSVIVSTIKNQVKKEKTWHKHSSAVFCGQEVRLGKEHR